MLEIVFIAIGLGLAVVGFLIWRAGAKKANAPEAPAPVVEEPKRSREQERYERLTGYSSTSGFGSGSSKSSSDIAAGTIQKWIGGAIAAVGLFIAVLFAIFGFFVQAGQGEAKIILNLDQSVDHVVEGPAIQTKFPWQSAIDFDLFSQEVVYAGASGDDSAPAYTGGQVDGKEVTIAVGGIAGGSTQGWADITITYSIDADQVEGIFKKYKTQERFTKQIIAKTILGTIRKVPSDYNAIEFRGGKRGEAEADIAEQVNAKLNKLGVTVDFVNIQDVRYPEAVEQALKDVEVAAQEVQKAEEAQRRVTVEAETAKIKAEGEAQAAIAKANGEAEANRLIAASLTPEVLAKLQIDAYDEGTIFTIPEGTTPFVSTGK